MMRKTETLLLGLLSIMICLFTSCGKTIRLTTDEIKRIPYQGNEVLVFHSNQGEVDTIFLLGGSKSKSPTDPLAIFPTEVESYNIGSTHSDPSPPSGNHRYLDGGFLNLSASENRESYFTLYLRGKDAWFYGGRALYLKQIDSMPVVSLKTPNRTYIDIIHIYPDTQEYEHRSNFITKVYWSKSEGVIRYDKKDNIYWELVKRYTP